MLIKRSLWTWYSRRLWPVTFTALLLVVVHVMCIQQVPYDRNGGLVLVFPLLHCLALNFPLNCLGRRDGVFLYTRGFSRGSLWTHRVLALVIHVLIVWLSATVLICSGLRAAFQYSVLGNPEFLVMDGVDAAVPWRCLGQYAAVICALQYASIRRWQPVRESTAGFWIATGLLLFPGLMAYTGPDGETVILTHRTFVVIWMILCAVCLLGSRILHDHVEVQA